MAQFFEGGLNNSGGELPPPDPKAGAAQGAAAGSVAGPWGAIIGAAAGLLGGLIAQKDAEKARKLAYEQRQQEAAQDRLYGAQNRQIGVVGEMGNREQSAIQQLMGVFARSAR